MKASIKMQLLIMCILLVISITISISAAYYFLAKEDKHRESQQRLQIAFEIIFDDLTRQIQFYTQHFEDQLQRDNTFRVAANFYLRRQNDILDYDTGMRPFLESRLSRLGELISVDRLALHTLDGELLVAYRRPGFTYTEQTNTLAEMELAQQSANRMPTSSEVKSTFNSDILKHTVTSLFREGEKLGFRITAPLFNNNEVTGVLIGDIFFTPQVVRRYTSLSKTEINFFAGEQLSLGTLPEQATLAAAVLETGGSCDELVKAEQFLEVISITFEQQDYYQGRCILRTPQQTIGAITVSLSQEIEKQEIKKILTAVLTIAGTGIAICFLLVSGFVVPAFTRPIISLTRVTSEIAKGNLQHAINTSRADELGVLARSFAHMRDEIQKKIVELQELNEKLEQRVKERTAEIARQNAEITRQKYILDTFMATVPNRIYFKDREGRITKANLAHAKCLGFQYPDEEIGKTDFDFYPEDRAINLHAQEQEIIRTGQPIINQECSMSRPDGSVEWSLVTKMPLHNENGEIIGIFGISRDITDLKHVQQELAQYRDRLEELVEERTAELVRINDRLQQEITKRMRIERALRLSEEQYRMLAENVVDGVAIIQNGILTFSNAGFARMLNSSRKQLIGKKPVSVFHEQFKSLVQERFCADTATFPDPRWQAQLVTHDQHTIWGEIDQTAITWDGKPACLLTIRDITERKRREKHLEKERARLQKENITLRSTVAERYKFGELVGKSSAMQQIYELIVSAAASEVNVLICGESGTGKELIARTIHQISQRRARPFVPVNCASIPETLFEREFFGHRKGAFTGADQRKPGLFDQAHQGTLFLDEVTELNPGMQAKLLRVLQDGVYYTPLGSPKSKQADVVIVAATNRDRNSLVEQGGLRQDFFYRICVIEIQTPPLRDRKEDLPLLIEFFLDQYRRKQERIHKRIPHDLPVDQTMFPPDVIQALYAYDWPGNVRELQNVLQRYLATQHLDLNISLISGHQRTHNNRGISLDVENMTLPEAVNTLEKQMITDVLARNEHHRLNTAKTLGITRRALQYKLKKYGLLG
jgi:PAS domain S-box-containing protein